MTDDEILDECYKEDFKISYRTQRMFGKRQGKDIGDGFTQYSFVTTAGNRVVALFDRHGAGMYFIISKTRGNKTVLYRHQMFGGRGMLARIGAHAFERYRERVVDRMKELAGVKGISTEAIVTLIIRGMIYGGFEAAENGERGSYITCYSEHGVFYGDANGKVLNYNTFVSVDMLKGDDREAFVRRMHRFKAHEGMTSREMRQSHHDAVMKFYGRDALMTQRSEEHINKFKKKDQG